MIPLVAWHRTRSLLLAMVVTAALLMARGTCAKDLDLRPGAKPGDTAAIQSETGRMLATLLPPRTDNASDWYAPLEPLHRCGEPRLLPTAAVPSGAAAAAVRSRRHAWRADLRPDLPWAVRAANRHPRQRPASASPPDSRSGV